MLICMYYSRRRLGMEQGILSHILVSVRRRTCLAQHSDVCIFVLYHQRRNREGIDWHKSNLRHTWKARALLDSLWHIGELWGLRKCLNHIFGCIGLFSFGQNILMDMFRGRDLLYHRQNSATNTNQRNTSFQNFHMTRSGIVSYKCVTCFMQKCR
jgi:hypothetical protein